MRPSPVVVGIFVLLSLTWGCGSNQKEAVAPITPPPISATSTAKEIAAFVNYLKAKGLEDKNYQVAYFPSGKVKSFHYQARNDDHSIEAIIDTKKHITKVTKGRRIKKGRITHTLSITIGDYSVTIGGKGKKEPSAR